MQVLIFGLSGGEYGISLKDVDFVSEKINVVKVPNAPEAVSGIAMLRGKVVPVYSLASHFGFAEQNSGYLVVAKVDGIEIALEIDTINRVIRIEKENVVSLPNMVRAMQPCLQEAIVYGEKLIGLLDIGSLVPGRDRRELCRFIEKNNKKALDLYSSTDYNDVCPNSDKKKEVTKYTISSEDGSSQ